METDAWQCLCISIEAPWCFYSHDVRKCGEYEDCHKCGGLDSCQAIRETINRYSKQDIANIAKLLLAGAGLVLTKEEATPAKKEATPEDCVRCMWALGRTWFVIAASGRGAFREGTPIKYSSSKPEWGVPLPDPKLWQDQLSEWRRRNKELFSACDLLLSWLAEVSEYEKSTLPKYDVDPRALVENLVNLLSFFAMHARQPSKRGRKSYVATRALAQWLCVIWKEFTGQEPTASRNNYPEYREEHTSAFLDFVDAVTEPVGITFSRRFVARVVWERKRPKK